MRPFEAEPDPGRRLLPVQRAVLGKNDALAATLRAEFQTRRLGVVNLLASPGSGKTALLVRTLRDLSPEYRMGVIVGDLATENDAVRLRATGSPVVQVNTGTVCHLDAAMVSRATAELGLDGLDLLFIENVGNLVCPAAYDLGESVRVVLLSVTEGEDKPLKYPNAFRSSQVVVLTKMDLAEATGFDRDAAVTNIRRVAPGATILDVSARTGAGLESWYVFLKNWVNATRS